VKVGDLVKWAQDGDIGIVIGIVGDSDLFSGQNYPGNPKIMWFTTSDTWTSSAHSACDKDLEVISESG